MLPEVILKKKILKNLYIKYVNINIICKFINNSIII